VGNGLETKAEVVEDDPMILVDEEQACECEVLDHAGAMSEIEIEIETNTSTSTSVPLIDIPLRTEKRTCTQQKRERTQKRKCSTAEQSWSKQMYAAIAMTNLEWSCQIIQVDGDAMQTIASVDSCGLFDWQHDIEMLQECHPVFQTREWCPIDQF
jgi:hypothetical protein